jgi:hypothetical protein
MSLLFPFRRLASSLSQLTGTEAEEIRPDGQTRRHTQQPLADEAKQERLITNLSLSFWPPAIQREEEDIRSLVVVGGGSEVLNFKKHECEGGVNCCRLDRNPDCAQFSFVPFGRRGTEGDTKCPGQTEPTRVVR